MQHSDEQKSALKSSMERLKVPVVKVVSAKGEIIDGALRAEIAATTGAKVYEYVMDDVTPLDRYRLNFAGLRELNAGQRAMTVVADDAAMTSVSKLTQREQNRLLAAAAGLGSPTFITYARHIRKYAPERASEIIDGTVALVDAYEQVKAKTAARNLAGSNSRWDPADVQAERDRRFTSPEIAEAVRAAFRGSDFLDAASEYTGEAGINPIGADRIYTRDDDGLKRDWESRTWCNFPFSRKASFLAKAVWEMRKGHYSYCLAPDDMSTKATHFAMRYARDILVFLGRPDFKKPNGESEKRPNFGTLIFGFGMSTQPLASELRKRGWNCTVLPSPKTYSDALDEIDALRKRLAAYTCEVAA